MNAKKFKKPRQVMNPDLLSSEALADANACKHTPTSDQLGLKEGAMVKSRKEKQGSGERAKMRCMTDTTHDVM